jgi:hypothetical protein
MEQQTIAVYLKQVIYSSSVSQTGLSHNSLVTQNGNGNGSVYAE